MAKKKRKKSYLERLYKSLVIKHNRWRKNNKSKKKRIKVSDNAKVLLLVILIALLAVFGITKYYSYLKIKKQTDLGYTKVQAAIIYEKKVDKVTAELGYSELFINSIVDGSYDKKYLNLYFLTPTLTNNTTILYDKLIAKKYTLDELKFIYDTFDEKQILQLLVYDKIDNLEDYQKSIKKNLSMDYYLKAYEFTTIQETLAIDGLVNKKMGLSPTYIPPNLTKISSYCAFNSSQLVEEAASHFETMCMDAKKENIFFASMLAYRSYEEQSKSYDGYANSYGTAQADAQVAHAGYSEHQSGLSVNVASMGSYPTGTAFTSKNEYTWLVEHVAEYGFIFRYPSDKENLTGFFGESDHLRYVGVEVATILKDLNITLEEYYVLYK